MHMRVWYVAMQENHRTPLRILLTYDHLQGNAALIGKGDCIRPKKDCKKTGGKHKETDETPRPNGRRVFKTDGPESALKRCSCDRIVRKCHMVRGIAHG